MVVVLGLGGTTTVVLVVTGGGGGVVRGWSGVQVRDVVGRVIIVVDDVDGLGGRVVTLVITVGTEWDVVGMVVEGRDGRVVTLVTTVGRVVALVMTVGREGETVDVGEMIVGPLAAAVEEELGLVLPASYAIASKTPLGILPRLRSCENTPLSSW